MIEYPLKAGWYFFGWMAFGLSIYLLMAEKSKLAN